MVRLQDLVPNADTLIHLEPEELGGVLLQVIASRPQNEGDFHPGSFIGSIENYQNPAYPGADQKLISAALYQAVAWLEGQALLVWPGQNGSNGWRTLGPRGMKFADPKNWTSFRDASALPKQLLHSRIREQTHLSFLRGDYEASVFTAFREVEISVREVAGPTNRQLGVALMREAFQPDAGRLADKTAERGEQVATMDLFAGAVGHFKNPHSHRSITLEPNEAIQMVMFATYLLDVVDARRPSNLAESTPAAS